MKSSIVSGMFFIILIAARQARYLMYGDEDFICFFTAGYNSRHISGVDTSAIAVKPKATT